MKKGVFRGPTSHSFVMVTGEEGEEGEDMADGRREGERKDRSATKLNVEKKKEAKRNVIAFGER